MTGYLIKHNEVTVQCFDRIQNLLDYMHLRIDNNAV
jgi:hypothetical protein